MRQSHAVATGPAEEPVSLAEAKLHLRIETADTAEDTRVAASISAARLFVESYCGKALVSQTLRMKLDEFPRDGRPIQLPRGPVSAISSVVYFDPDGASQTIDSTGYIANLDLEPAEISLGMSSSWPSTAPQAAAITITYVAGWASAAAVPALFKQAILLLVGTWMANRESVVVGVSAIDLPDGVAALLAPARLYAF